MASNQKLLNELERKTLSIIGKIRRKEIDPEESKIGVFINKIKDMDQALYEHMIQEYKKAITEK